MLPKCQLLFLLAVMSNVILAARGPAKSKIPKLARAGIRGMNRGSSEDHSRSSSSSEIIEQLAGDDGYNSSIPCPNEYENCERAIIRRLFKNYKKYARPVRNDSTAIQVQVNPGFMGLLDVQEVTQSIMVNIWMRFYWTDEYLGWDPEEFGGKTVIRIPVHEVWVPDVVIYQELGETTPMHEEMKRVSISYDGKVSLLYPSVHNFFCPMSMRRFPFDTQHCEMRFGTWFHKAHEVHLTAKNDFADTRFLKPNSEWLVVGVDLKEELKQYLEFPISEVAFKMHIRRYPIFYLVTLIVPTTLIMLVSIIGVFSPSKSHEEREEKISMAMTTLLTLAVLLLMISDQMPKSAEEIPTVAVYIMFQLILIVIAAVCSVVIITLQRNSIWDRAVPPMLYKLCGLRPLCGACRSKNRKTQQFRSPKKAHHVDSNTTPMSPRFDNHSPILSHPSCNNDVHLSSSGVQMRRKNQRRRSSTFSEEPKVYLDDSRQDREKRHKALVLEWARVCDRLDCICRAFLLLASFLTVLWLISTGMENRSSLS